MKSIQLTCLTLIAIGCSRVGHAQATGSTAWVYDLKYNESSAVVLKQIGTLHNVIGKGFELDVQAFAGSNVSRKGRPVAGVLLTRGFDLAQEVSGLVGFGLNTQDGRQVSFVVAAGASWRF